MFLLILHIKYMEYDIQHMYVFIIKHMKSEYHIFQLILNKINN